MKVKRLVMLALAVVVLLLTLVARVNAQGPDEPAAPASTPWIEIAQKAIMVVIQLAIPPLLAWAIAQFKKWREERAQDTWFWVLEGVVRDAVAAAEQLGLTGQLSQLAESKLDYAIDYVERALEARGFPIDLDPYVDVIRGMIEAEVNRQFPHTEVMAIG